MEGEGNTMDDISRYLVDPEQLATMPAASIERTAAGVLATAERTAEEDDAEDVAEDVALYARAQALYAAASHRLLAELADSLSRKGGTS
jgi:hypothetical protein